MSFYAAFGEVELPCPYGTPIAGWGPPRRDMRMKLDPIEACLAILKNEEKTLVLISMDLVGVSGKDCTEIRCQVAEAVGTTPDAVMAACTHNHCGPSTEDSYDTPRNEEFVAETKRLIAQKARELAGMVQPAVLGSGFTYENDITWNRRYILRDGRAWAHPQLDKMEALYAEGPIDPQVSVLCVRDMDGSALGYVVNFACHPLFYGGQRIATANFPGVLRRELKKKENPGCVTVFLQGAAGDVSHANPFDTKRTTMESVGIRLAERSYETALTMQYTEEVQLAAVAAETTVPKRRLSEYHLERAKRVLAGEELEIEPMWHAISTVKNTVFAQELIDLQAAAERDPDIPVVVQAMRIGDTAWATAPGELFVKLGMQIKLRSKIEKTYVAAYSNGKLGYICTPEAYEHGGYEATPCGGSKIGPEGGAKLVEEACKLLEQL